MALTPELRVMRARLANAALRAKYPGAELTRAATAVSQTALNKRLIEQHGIDVDAPDFEKRLKAAREFHYRQMAFRRWRAQ